MLFEACIFVSLVAQVAQEKVEVEKDRIQVLKNLEEHRRLEQKQLEDKLQVLSVLNSSHLSYLH